METAPYFSFVHDPRVVGRCKYKFSDILMVALTLMHVTIQRGAKGWLYAASHTEHKWH